MFFEIVVFALLFLGGVLILAGVLSGLMGGGDVIIEIGKRKFVFRGREAALFALLGSLLVAFAVYLMSTAGSDRRPSDGSSRGAVGLSVPVYAQPPMASPQPPMARPWQVGDNGWVYLGPIGDPDEWVFRAVPSDATEDMEAPPYGAVVQAVGPAFLREAHGNDFSGTILGIFFPEPRHVADVSEGDCARVVNREDVGFRSLWLEVEKTDCPEQ